MTYLKKIATATNLKYLAFGLMFLDHIHEMFIEMGAPSWLNICGRLVFPIFLFLAADSFYYTRDRKKYMLRLLLMSWLMIIGNMIVGSLFQNGHVGLANNAFSTFFITGVYIWSWDFFVKGIKNRSAKDFGKGLILFLLPIICALPMILLFSPSLLGSLSPLTARLLILLVSLIPNILMVEGGFLLVLLGLLFYIFREKRLLQILSLALITILLYLSDPASIQWTMIFAALPIFLYNGQKGRGDKYFFYIFYPVHIYALYILASLIG